jgi:hypothetical protein
VLIKTSLSGVIAASWLFMGCAAESNGGAGPAPAVASAAPAAPAAQTVCATFYADAALKGATLVSLGPTDNSPTVPAAFNDAMSSVAVTPGCTVSAYADGNYGGQEVTFDKTAELVPPSMNDQMSSYKCSCGSSGAAK